MLSKYFCDHLRKSCESYESTVLWNISLSLKKKFAYIAFLTRIKFNYIIQNKIEIFLSDVMKWRWVQEYVLSADCVHISRNFWMDVNSKLRFQLPQFSGGEYLVAWKIQSAIRVQTVAWYLRTNGHG